METEVNNKNIDLKPNTSGEGGILLITDVEALRGVVANRGC